MAKGAKKTSTKRGSSAKARGGSAGKQRSTAKKPAAQKRGASRKRAPQSSGTENLLASVSTLAGSAVGREIIADVLEAAAAALRKGRGDIRQDIQTGVEQMTEATGSAVNVASEVATGTVGLAQTAAGVLAEVATDAARSMLGGSSDDDESGKSGRRGRAKSSGS